VRPLWLRVREIAVENHSRPLQAVLRGAFEQRLVEVSVCAIFCNVRKCLLHAECKGLSASHSCFRAESWDKSRVEMDARFMGALLNWSLSRCVNGCANANTKDNTQRLADDKQDSKVSTLSARHFLLRINEKEDEAHRCYQKCGVSEVAFNSLAKSRAERCIVLTYPLSRSHSRRAPIKEALRVRVRLNVCRQRLGRVEADKNDRASTERARDESGR